MHAKGVVTGSIPLVLSIFIYLVPVVLSGDMSIEAAESRKNRKITFYRVKKGDTLCGIAKRFEIPQRRLCSLNDLAPDTRLKSGMMLKLVPDAGQKSRSRSERIWPRETQSGRDSPGPRPDFVWPIRRADGFSRDGSDGVRPIGIIIQAKNNTPVIASAGGTVKKIGVMRGFGRYVIILHEGRYTTVYSNMKDVSIREGESVLRGRPIGRVDGNSGLHFQIGRKGKPRNPLAYLPSKGTNG